MNKDKLLFINEEVVKIVKSLNMLEKISWPADLEKEFFNKLNKTRKPVLNFTYPKYNLHDKKKKLVKLKKELSKENPLHIYTANTIDSYIKSIDMIHSIGSKAFEDVSIEEYGRPTHLLFESKYSHLEMAKSFINAFDDYEHPYVIDNRGQFSAQELRKFLMRESKATFAKEGPRIVLSRDIAPRAAAGKNRVRLREGAIFSDYDFNQLLVHEIMTHSLTAINGSLQTKLPILGLGAPRTTKTQEGLATFAEIITGSLDLARLKRLALRVIALEMALEGADFYDLYDFFLLNGQDSKESYLSASRLLRGGFASGGIAFTKDGVYLEGLIRVHSFFRWAFKTKNLQYTHLLFCGRMDINDIFLLMPAYEEGLIDDPKFLPSWYKSIDLLAGKMAFSLILNGIDLQAVDSHFSNKCLKNVA